MKLSSLAALSFGVLLSGCSAQVPEPRALPTAAPPTAAVSAPAPEVSEPEIAYSYFPRRDPFTPAAPCCRPPPPDFCTEPLCRYTLDELKLAGVISGMANPVAVLESPKGKGYPVYRGSKVGKRGGVVKQVLRDSIVVAEVWSDGKGLSHEEEVTLRLKPDAPLMPEE
jgi:type IV pilus assembly protein PilP